MDNHQIPDQAKQILSSVETVILGQSAAIRQCLVAIIARGHALLEGVPGTAKSLMARSLSMALDVSYRRIQFTPDLMPADITGFSLVSQDGDFRFRSGPIFADVILADEINRAPAKTQAALLEAMQERTVTVDGNTHPLSDVFTVFATQNPVEFEGTYPLPEAELDRFLLNIFIDYPDQKTEDAILDRYLSGFEADRPSTYNIGPVVGEAGIESLRRTADAVRVEPQLVRYITSIVRATRETSSLTLGAGPRASVALLKCARASAVLDGRDYVIPDDVKGLATSVLRHRISVAPELELEGLTAERAVVALLEQVEVPTV